MQELPQVRRVASNQAQMVGVKLQNKPGMYGRDEMSSAATLEGAVCMTSWLCNHVAWDVSELTVTSLWT